MRLFHELIIDSYDEFLRKQNNLERLKANDKREAITIYLVNKHGWKLDYAASLSTEALEVILAEELKSFKSPKELYSIYKKFNNFIEPFEKAELKADSEQA
jgi:hypothetical protein